MTVESRMSLRGGRQPDVAISRINSQNCVGEAVLGLPLQACDTKPTLLQIVTAPREKRQSLEQIATSLRSSQ